MLFYAVKTDNKNALCRYAIYRVSMRIRDKSRIYNGYAINPGYAMNNGYVINNRYAINRVSTMTLTTAGAASDVYYFN